MGHHGFEPLLADRDTRNVDEKRRIAAAAAGELPPVGTLLLDSGSTTVRVAQRIPADASLTIITNSVVAAQLLADHDHVEVVVLGGALDKKTLATVDEETVAAVRAMTVDTLILGTDGMTPDGGLTTPYRAQAALKRAMMDASRRVIVVADSSKAGHDHFVRFAEWGDVDVLITDAGLDEVTASRFEATGHGILVRPRHPA